MDKRHLFYRYYDTLFSSKDYAGEIAAIFRYVSGYPRQTMDNVLEIGCGTGSHTVELARKPGVQVTAVDTDPYMLVLAKMKAEQTRQTNITFASGSFSASGMDLGVALFNVVNYICDDAMLGTFFAGIAASLRLHGLFIFDCWNGTAALLEPPGSKNYEQDCDGKKVCCQLTSKTDLVRKITTLNYQLNLFDQAGKKLESNTYKILHRLWTPEQIKAALQDAGFEVLTVCIPFKFEQVASDTDWKIMFVCRNGG